MTSEFDAGLERRTVVTAALWAAPAIVVARGVPMAATSTTPTSSLGLGVIAVRASGPNWDSTTQPNLAPGFRFSAAVATTVDLAIIKTGASATSSQVLTAYDNIVWSAGPGTYASTSVPISPAKTLGVTVKAVDLAVGTYTAAIYPHGDSTPSATAVFTVYKESGVFKVRLGA